MTTRQPHSPGCDKGFLVMINKVNNSIFPYVVWRGRWDCPACASKKLADKLSHLLVQSDTLCWGPCTKANQKNANRQALGFMTIGYRDDIKIMVAPSHLFEPVLPGLEAAKQLIDHTSTRIVSRIGWSDGWRPDPERHPENWEVIDAKTDNLATVRAAIKQAGFGDGIIGGVDPSDARSRIEQLLTGSTFTWQSPA